MKLVPLANFGLMIGHEDISAFIDACDSHGVGFDKTGDSIVLLISSDSKLDKFYEDIEPCLVDVDTKRRRTVNKTPRLLLAAELSTH